MKNWKKVLILGTVLLIIAGIVVVALKGFNVSLMNMKHENIEMNIGKEVDLDKLNEICKEVFGDREFKVKELELFGDSFQINIESITDGEKENLISKINEKFEVSKKVEDLTISSVAKVRIRDNVKKYIWPLIIVYAISYAYIAIRFRKLSPLKMVLTNAGTTAITEASLLSLIAVTRIPVFNSTFFILVAVAIAELTYFFISVEKKSSKKVETEK